MKNNRHSSLPEYDILSSTETNVENIWEIPNYEFS